MPSRRACRTPRARVQVCMDWIGKVDVLEYYPDTLVESASAAFPVPAVMKVRFTAFCIMPDTLVESAAAAFPVPAVMKVRCSWPLIVIVQQQRAHVAAAGALARARCSPLR
jgi:hypothetical protein